MRRHTSQCSAVACSQIVVRTSFGTCEGVIRHLPNTPSAASDAPLTSVEYRISRAIHDVLGHRNVSHDVNRYRLDHARALLADPDCDGWSTLVVGLESGFGSLGAFHRAFKAEEGCTPGEYRAARPAPGDDAGPQLA